MKKLKELLIRSFDAIITSNEKKELETTLKNSDELRQEKDLLEQIRDTISKTGIDSFRFGFADRVIYRLNTNDVLWFGIQPFDLVAVFKPVGIAAGLAVIGLLIFQFSVGNILSIESLLGIPEYTVENFTYAVQ